jgi:iron uptake system component EfeO
MAYPLSRVPRFGPAVAALAVVAIAGCASGGTASGSLRPGSIPERTIRITLTDAGCPPVPTTISAGPVTFQVANQDATMVTELEVTSAGRIIGEKENLAPGLAGSFSLDLAAGEYGIECPGAATDETTLTVTAPVTAAPSGAVTGPTAAPGDGALAAALRDAVVGYAAYVRATVDALVPATEAFAAAVEAGDVERAKTLYPTARIFYERIEPVAESFGDLDPAIDIRIADVADPATWTGFHRLEEALWARGTTDGMAPIARRLVDDVGRLKRLVDAADYQPAQLANGASELLDEVARSKVTGEEEAYSRLDLVDFAANIDGAKAAFELLRPALEIVDPALATTISDRFRDVQAGLVRFRAGAHYVTYDRLTPADVRDLSAKVSALAEPLSQVAARVVGGS